MKIGIQTWGSNGDVRPMLALADGLQKAGHQVTLVVTPVDNQSYQSICEQLQIGYRQVPERIVFDMEGFVERSFRMNPVQWLRALLDEAFFPAESLIFQAAQSSVAKRVTVKALAQAIKSIISDPGYGNRAQHISEHMQAHDGVARAVKLLTKNFDPLFKKGASSEYPV
jgi:UDP:flavonoid glycosyltransferase YjiC (YdhE family)